MKTLGIAVVGAIFGAGLVTLLAGLSTPSSDAATVAVTSEPSTGGPAVPDPEGLGELRARLGDVERQLAAQRATAETGVAVDSGPEPSPAEIRALEESAYRGKLADHEREPRLATFADATEPLFYDDLRAFARDGGFEVGEVDCRRRSCTATVVWPSFHAAVAGYGAVLHPLYQANCGREILLPEPDDQNAPYEGTVYFDCQNLQ